MYQMKNDSESKVQNDQEQKEACLLDDGYYKMIIARDYYGIEVLDRESNMSVLISSIELIRLAQKVISRRFYFNYQNHRNPQREIEGLLNQFNGGYVFSSIESWLTLSDYLSEIQRREGYQGTIKPVVVNCGGRKINVFNPSNRYVFDFGSHERFNDDLHNCLCTGNMEEFFSAITQSNDKLYLSESKTLHTETSQIVRDDETHYMYTKSKDAISGLEGRGLSYNFMAKYLLDNVHVSDPSLTEMIRELLRGYEPLEEDTITQFNRDKRSAEKWGGERDYISLEEIQPAYSLDLIEMPPILPAMTCALFAAESSRSTLSFLTSLLLLDLIEAEIKVKLNGRDIPITWLNCLKHWDYDATKKQNETDPTHSLIRIGGLHPMTHTGSYMEFERDINQTNEPLSWAHVKSAVVLITWLECYFQECDENSLEVQGLSREEYFAKLNVPSVATPLTDIGCECRSEAAKLESELLERIYDAEPSDEEYRIGLTRMFCSSERHTRQYFRIQEEVSTKISDVLFEILGKENNFKNNLSFYPSKVKKRKALITEILQQCDIKDINILKIIFDLCGLNKSTTQTNTREMGPLSLASASSNSAMISVPSMINSSSSSFSSSSSSSYTTSGRNLSLNPT